MTVVGIRQGYPTAINAALRPIPRATSNCCPQRSLPLCSGAVRASPIFGRSNDTEGI